MKASVIRLLTLLVATWVCHANVEAQCVPAPANIFEPGYYELGNKGNGGDLSPPDYGFRFSGLFGDYPNHYTFDNNHPESRIYLHFDGSNIRVFGVTYGGRDIWSFSKKELNHFRNTNIGFIFQSFYMQPSESVLKNVNLPLEIAGVGIAERKAKSMKALEQLGIADKAQNKATDLSGGQKQRVCIARAIAAEPDVLFADEPTGNLDSATGAVVEDIIFDLNKKGLTVIIVTHDEELAAKCNAQIHMKDGVIEKITGKGVQS